MSEKSEKKRKRQAKLGHPGTIIYTYGVVCCDGNFAHKLLTHHITCTWSHFFMKLSLMTDIFLQDFWEALNDDEEAVDKNVVEEAVADEVK